MKRILVLLSVVMMMVATVAPALSQHPPPPQAAGPNCERGQAQALDNAEDRRDVAGIAKHEENQDDCEDGDAPGEGFDK